MKTALLISIIALLPCTILGQQTWVPYSAEIIETTVNIDASGAKSTIISSEMKARSANGSVVTERFAPNSREVIREQLYDASRQIDYMVDFEAKRAIGRIENRTIRPKDQSEPVARETIAGVAASAYPIKNAVTKKADGRIWIADGTDIPVRMEITFPNGGSYRLETSEIRIGQEPPASLFLIPHGFQVSGPASAN
jgi:hypothetical protein